MVHHGEHQPRGIFSMVLDRRYGSNWRLVVAAIGCLILSSSEPSAQTPDRQWMPHPGPAVEAETQREARGGRHPSEPPPVPVRIIQTIEEAEYNAAREAKSDQHDAEDLKAQVRAADAASEQIAPSWAAAVLSGIGTILLVWTLCETRKTAKAAVAGVKAANRAAKAAEQANLESRYSQRAWVSFSKLQPSADIGDDGKVLCFHFKFVWSNSGPTPAINATMRFASFNAANSYNFRTFPEHLLIGDNERATTIGPSLPAYSGSFELTREHIEMIIGKTRRVFFWSRVEYFDIFNSVDLRVSEVCLEVTSDYTFDAALTPRETDEAFTYSPVGPRNAHLRLQTGTRTHTLAPQGR